MNMKKLMAGVVAGALAVSSLATVGVFAEDDVRAYVFTTEKNTVTFSYENTINYKEAVDVADVFGSTYEDVNVQFQVSGYGAKSGYTLGYLASELAAKFPSTALYNTTDFTITVVGTKTVNDKTETVTVKATANDKKYPAPTYAEVVVTPYVTLRFEKDGGANVLSGSDLDLTKLEEIKSISVKGSFTVDTGALKVNPDGVFFNVKPVFTGAGVNVDDMTKYWCTATAKTETDGSLRPSVNQGGIYTFEGNQDSGEFVFMTNGYANTKPVYAQSLGRNLLRWVNDNIIQNKGAKLRITFMTPAKAQDALSQGQVQVYQTTVDNKNVLVPPTNSGTDATTNDVMIGVNLPYSSKLQQAADIKDYVVEFDWDSLVQNSAYTVSANVASIAIRVNPDSSNVDNLFGADGSLVIEKMEIVIPDQSTVAGDDKVISLTSGSDDANVKVTGTIGVIYGNGAQDLQVTSDITDTNIKYSLKLTDANGNYVQPAGSVTLQMSIPSKFKGQTLSADTVKHTCNDGTVEELAIKNMDTYKTDGYIVCETSKFSSFEFGFEGSNEEETITEAPAVSEETTTEASADTQPADDGNQPTGVALAVIPAIVAAAGIVISKKRG